MHPKTINTPVKNIKNDKSDGLYRSIILAGIDVAYMMIDNVKTMHGHMRNNFVT